MTAKVNKQKPRVTGHTIAWVDHLGNSTVQIKPLTYTDKTGTGKTKTPSVTFKAKIHSFKILYKAFSLSYIYLQKISRD